MGVTFLKRGKDGAALSKQADADTAAKRAAASNTVFRFWMPPEAEQQITFLDGEVDATGRLDVPTYWEHNLLLGGSWKNWFPCTKDQEPCPICETKQPSLVYMFTIIDHRQWAEKKDTSKVHEHERKLYVCKGDTYKRLSKLALKRGGLTGLTVDVSRIGDNAENVGSDFDFCEKRSFKELRKIYGMKKTGENKDSKVCAAYDYDEVMKYHTAEQLRALGLGEGGGEPPVGAGDADEVRKDKKKGKKKKGKKKKGKGKKATSESDYDKDL